MHTFNSPKLAGLAATLLLAMAGCANQPLKSDKLQLARESVEQVTGMGGNEFAPAEMQAARERVDFARTALTAGDLARADKLSDEVLVNTRLAQTRIQSAKAQKAASELVQGRRALQIEIQNNTK